MAEPPSLARRRLVVVLVLLSAIAGSWIPVVKAEPIQLRPAEYVTNNGTPLHLEAHAIPCVTDWNGDGLKDLIVGYRYADKVALFLNCGTESQPAFTNSVNLQAGGVDIQHPAGAGGCGAPAPWVCDYDGDGKRDLLVGTGLEGYVYFYRNTNTDAQPLLAPGVQLMVNAAPLTVPARATPYVHDWDEDGLKDLICGAGDGFVYFFKNAGTAQSPVYAPATRIQAGGSDLNLGIRSAVRVYDWDGDGLKDLVGSAANNVSWCRNVGSNSTPKLNAPVPLRSPVAGVGLTNINVGSRMRLELTDWNNDGVLDLLIGNQDGFIVYYEGYHFAFRNIASQPGGWVALEWTSASFLNYSLLAGNAPDCVTNSIAVNVPSGGKTTIWTNRPQEEQQFYRVTILR